MGAEGYVLAWPFGGVAMIAVVLGEGCRDNRGSRVRLELELEVISWRSRGRYPAMRGTPLWKVKAFCFLFCFVLLYFIFSIDANGYLRFISSYEFFGIYQVLVLVLQKTSSHYQASHTSYFQLPT